MEDMENHPISFQDYVEKRFTQKLWLSDARVSLKLTCNIEELDACRSIKGFNDDE